MRQLFLVTGRQCETRLLLTREAAVALAQDYIGWHEYGCSQTPRQSEPPPAWRPHLERPGRRGMEICTCSWPIRVRTDATGVWWRRHVFGLNVWSRMQALDAPRAPSWSWRPWLYLVRTYDEMEETGATLFRTLREARRFANDPANEGRLARYVDPVERLPAPGDGPAPLPWARWIAAAIALVFLAGMLYFQAMTGAS